MGHDETEPGGSGGVFSLSRGEENSWEKGNLYTYAKYYYQPRATYVEHTMNGVADYMHGFKGYGLGLSYTLTRDCPELEYDDLEDLQYGTRSRTLWAGFPTISRITGMRNLKIRIRRKERNECLWRPCLSK